MQLIVNIFVSLHALQKELRLRFVTTLILSLVSLCSFSQERAHLLFTGEINVGNNYSVKNQPEIDASKLFSNVASELQSSTATFSTLGTVFIDVAGTPNRANLVGSHKLIRMSEAYGSAIAKSGFTALNLANSHVSDFGIEGIQGTINVMKENGMEYAGIKALKDYTIFERKGLTYGFVAFGSSVHAPSMADSTTIRKVVAGLDDKCDIVVVAFSFDGNNSAIHTATATRPNKDAYMNNAHIFAHTCIDAGADIVYGNGYNLPQPIELYKDRLIIYGLGNFCTPYGVSYTGELGAAPIIETNLYADGTFESGKIVSYKQTNASGPKADPTLEAVKIIKSQTLRQFPKTELKIEDNGNITSTSETAYAFALRLLKEAERHKGKPYRMGSTGPATFDCSGFTSYVFGKMGITLKRTAAEQYTMGTTVDKDNLRPGDLVFFTRSSVRGVGHVGIVYSVDKKTGSFKFIHASTSKGIAIDDFATSAYYIRRYVGAKRVINK